MKIVDVVTSFFERSSSGSGNQGPEWSVEADSCHICHSEAYGVRRTKEGTSVFWCPECAPETEHRRYAFYERLKKTTHYPFYTAVPEVTTTRVTFVDGSYRVFSTTDKTEVVSQLDAESPERPFLLFWVEDTVIDVHTPDGWLSRHDQLRHEEHIKPWITPEEETIRSFLVLVENELTGSNLEDFGGEVVESYCGPYAPVELADVTGFRPPECPSCGSMDPQNLYVHHVRDPDDRFLVEHRSGMRFDHDCNVIVGELNEEVYNPTEFQTTTTESNATETVQEVQDVLDADDVTDL